MKILVVDDHALVREGIAAVLLQSISGAQILHARDGQSMTAQLTEHSDVALVLLDLKLPEADGHTLLEDLIWRHPELKVIMVSSSESPSDVQRALALGARGYVAKSSASETLRAAIDLVLAGQIYVPPFVMTEAISPRTNERPVLTKRQTEVVRYIAADLSNKDIAARLGLSEKTVKAHISLIFRQLNVVNRVQAARAAAAAAII